ncbi:hypothetical protein EMCRGX_G015505 [Ephydatia muelleri]
MVGRSAVGWWGGVQWDGGDWDGGEEYNGMERRSRVGWWEGVEWDGGKEYSGMVGMSTVGWWGGVQWDGGEEYSGMVGRSTGDGEEYSGMVGRSTVGWWGVGWWGGVQWDGGEWDGGEEYSGMVGSGMVGRSTVGWWGVGWWGGVQWDGGEGGVQWDGGEEYSGMLYSFSPSTVLLPTISLYSSPPSHCTPPHHPKEVMLAYLRVGSLVNKTYIRVGSLVNKTYDQFLEKLPAAVSNAALLGGGTMITGVALYGFTWVYHRRYNMTNSVKKRFLNPNPPPLIREGEHFPREKEEKEIQKAFLMDQTDSLGLVGVVFGPAGTGKSNVVRTVCRSNTKGVIYMEIGSPRQFPYHLAKACGVPVEPNWWDAVVAKLFGTFRTYVTLPSSDQDALALVLPIIAEGAKAYIKKNKSIPVLFIDGVDILAKEEDNRLYVNLVDWAKKCANEDSLRIVLVCSDSHVLVLDQQSFKSRLDALIEIDDASETQAVNELMMGKYEFTEDLAKSTYDIVGGRLADIHKMVSIRRRGYSVIPQEVVKATEHSETADALRDVIHKALNGRIENPNEDKSNEIKDESKRMLIKDIITSYNFKQQFIREMEQALCKALGKDKHEIKKFIIQQVLKANGTKTVEEIAFL